MRAKGGLTARPAFRRWAVTLLVLLIGVLATGVEYLDEPALALMV